mmetsp:Transcript_19653/g.34899  ORF Transcript_19653/g.34899 Transcript_19653/m.34899 type:complete len:88 (-) Transcript_19653:13-276(-)
MVCPLWWCHRAPASPSHSPAPARCTPSLHAPKLRRMGGEGEKGNNSWPSPDGGWLVTDPGTGGPALGNTKTQTTAKQTGAVLETGSA